MKEEKKRMADGGKSVTDPSADQVAYYSFLVTMIGAALFIGFVIYFIFI